MPYDLDDEELRWMEERADELGGEDLHSIDTLLEAAGDEPYGQEEGERILSLARQKGLGLRSRDRDRVAQETTLILAGGLVDEPTRSPGTSRGPCLIAAAIGIVTGGMLVYRLARAAVTRGTGGTVPPSASRPTPGPPPLCVPGRVRRLPSILM